MQRERHSQQVSVDSEAEQLTLVAYTFPAVDMMATVRDGVPITMPECATLLHGQ